MLARVMATGMNTIQDERPPSTIVPRASFIAVLALEPFSGALFDFLGAGRRHVSQHFNSGDFPRPWRLIVRRHIATNVEDQRCIDWQIDPISGFRWRPSIRSSAIRYGDQPCVEVKWPWELGRLQHLPAIAAQISDPISDHGVQSASVIQDHIVDFVRSNPPGFGVQWLCPMDVGIRIANLLVAVDLARAAGVKFEDKFLQLVSATARDHGRHISRHLEWGDRLCSNHYLANVAGLLFVTTTHHLQLHLRHVFDHRVAFCTRLTPTRCAASVVWDLSPDLYYERMVLFRRLATTIVVDSCDFSRQTIQRLTYWTTLTYVKLLTRSLDDHCLSLRLKHIGFRDGSATHCWMTQGRS